MYIGSYVNYDCFANDVIFFAAELIITKRNRKSSEVISNLLEVESFKFKSDKGHPPNSCTYFKTEAGDSCSRAKRRCD